MTAQNPSPDHARTDLTDLGLPPSVKAVLFDMDGVLTDTASVHRAAWKDAFDPVLAAHDQPPFTEQDYLTFVDGKPRLDGVRDFLAARGITPPEGGPDDAHDAETVHAIGTRKNDQVQRHLRTDGVTVFDSSVAYLRAVRDAGLRAAVVTASRNGEQVLAAAGLADLVEARVDGVVAADQGLPGKPQPDTFLAAARAVGVEAGEAAVVEDAVSGVQAGRAGGFGYVVGVDRGDNTDALRAAGADVVVTDLAQLRRGGGGA
ncbi:HAD family hydrolase [Thalassiella azotivora]